MKLIVILFLITDFEPDDTDDEADDHVFDDTEDCFDENPLQQSISENENNVDGTLFILYLLNHFQITVVLGSVYHTVIFFSDKVSISNKAVWKLSLYVS